MANSSSETHLVPSRTEPLTAKELYLFDAMGIVRLPGLLSRETAAQCREEVLGLSSLVMQGRGDKVRYNDLFARSPALSELAGSTAIRGLVEPVINQPYRLIESYALRRESNSVFYLHNGLSEVVRYGKDRSVRRNMSLHHTFHDGKLYCMFVKLLIYLRDVRTEEDGPFCYLQGSHKTNFPFFKEGLDLDEKPALNTANFPSLEHTLADAGDGLLLNEALLHGTLPKTSEGERLVMAFSYAPAFVADWKEIDAGSQDLRKLGHY